MLKKSVFYILLLSIVSTGNFAFAGTSGSLPKANKNLTGTVIRITDGDTLTIAGRGNKRTKIRLYGIDAPEKKQEFGIASRDYLKDLVGGQKVKIKVMNIDRYGRVVGRIRHSGKEISSEMLKAGMGWYYSSYCKINLCKKWQKHEQYAKTSQIGLWANPSAQEPWLWRKNKN